MLYKGFTIFRYGAGWKARRGIKGNQGAIAITRATEAELRAHIDAVTA